MTDHVTDHAARRATRAVVVDDSTLVREAMPLLVPGVRFVGRVRLRGAPVGAGAERRRVALDLRLAGGESDGARLQGIHAVRAVSAR